MIRLLVSDIDGTLVTRDKQLTAATRDAARRLGEHGIALVLVSSRPPHGVALFAESLGLDTPRAAFNGGAFISPAGEIISMRVLAEDAARQALDHLAAQNIDPWLFTADEWLLRDPGAHYVAWEQRTVKMPYRVVQDYEEAFAKAGKIMAASGDFAKLKACEQDLQTRLGERAAVHLSQDYYLDITHPDANKGEAVREAARLLGVPLEQTACIGDMPNDLPMFEVAAHSIAMGNAPDFMRDQADFITRTNEEDGWAHAVERFVIPASGSI